MKKILLLKIVLSISIICTSCEKNSTSVNNSLTPLSLEEAIKHVSIGIVDYDSVQISSKETFVLESKSIDKISIERYIVYNQQSATIKETFNPKYEGSPGAYMVIFDHGFKATGECSINVKFHLTNQDSMEIDTLMKMYKYPYTSTEIFLELEYTTQGFEIVGDDIYFCPSGGLAGIWRDNLLVEQDAEALYGTVAGDLIAADSQYVFHDPSHSHIIRYNIDEEQVDHEFDWPGYDYQNINIEGLTVYDNSLYANISEYGYDTTKILKFDFNGNVLDSIQLTKRAYQMEIHDDICYFLNWNDKTIERFDLNTETYLESFLFPSQNIEGIRIYNDYFYFVDWYHKTLYRFSMADLNL